MRLAGYCAAFPVVTLRTPSGRPAFLHSLLLSHFGLPLRRLHLLARVLGRVALLLLCGGRHGIADGALDVDAHDDFPYNTSRRYAPHVRPSPGTSPRSGLSQVSLTRDITAPRPGPRRVHHSDDPTRPAGAPCAGYFL